MTRENIVVFSGGSAANNLVDVFGAVAQGKSLSYVIPISDNGGSSSELIRVFGGPGIGDVRSRLIRLIPEDPTSPEKAALKSFFNHRLSSSPSQARSEWHDIVEAQHPLWTHITSEKRELIRSFLNLLNLEIVKRTRPPTNIFNFQTASVGNLFLTGARLFSGSFESAIYLLSSITGVPTSTSVIPAINSNFSHHICAGLVDGTCIVGQNSISHPTISQDVDPVSPQSQSQNEVLNLGSTFHDHEDANPPSSHPSLLTPSIIFHKSTDPLQNPPLPSPIHRIWYINPYGQEIRPSPNPKVLSSLRDSSCVIYSIGSLYTSIIPCLVLRDVGEVIATSVGLKFKILVLNGCLDRETGLGMGAGSGLNREEKGGFSGEDFIRAIVQACEESRGRGVLIGSEKEKKSDDMREWKKYVTHVVYLSGEGTPRVDTVKLREVGIETVRIYGRKVEGGEGMVYDGKGLTQALEVILGKRGCGRGEKSRRNTLEG